MRLPILPKKLAHPLQLARVMDQRARIGMLVAALVLGLTGACSSATRTSESRDSSSNGPAVFHARTEPGTIELNAAYQPVTPATVLADVKDFNSNVTDVRLHFLHVPIDVPMENIGGTTWRATLSPRQLQLLAVTGKTIQYDANVVAKDENGQSGVSRAPVQVAIKTPDITQEDTG